jgi:hypothetical protein
MTPDDFTVQYDADHVISVIEDEHGRVFAYGHDSEAVARLVTDFYALASGSPEEPIGPDEVYHLWAVTTSDEPDEEMWYFGFDITDTTPGAWPLSMVFQ